GHLWYHRPFFFSSRGRHTRFSRDWSSDVCSSDLPDSGKRVVHKASLPRVSQPRSNSVDGQVNGDLNFTFHRFCFAPTARSGAQRSEERRVGKECGARWARGHENSYDTSDTDGCHL